jgi:hypothetical protein
VTKSEQVTVVTSRQRKVLDGLQSGVLTWEGLRSLTKISDDGLGFVIGELIDLRKIWTTERNGVRVYGIERRTKLVTRSAPEQRRSSDSLI